MVRRFLTSALNRREPEPLDTATPPSAPLASKGADVAVIMGSRSDWPTLRYTVETLEALGVPVHAKIISAHRTPERMLSFAKAAKANGYKVIVAGAGGAAHLPGMTASMTELPVLGVPVRSESLSGLDSLLSIVQMPGGVPVATLAIGKAGAKNAGILAAQILALSDPALAQRLAAFRAAETAAVPDAPEDARPEDVRPEDVRPEDAGPEQA